jgi:hypothetical protein
MATTVIGLIEDSSEAKKAVDELLRNGFDRKDVGVITGDVIEEAATAVGGASVGMLAGGVAGMLLGAAALMIPGLGPVLVAGPALTLFGATTLGMLAGGLIGGLTARGVPEEDAHFYAEGVKRGATLITVSAKDDTLAQRAVEVLKRHGAVDLNERAAQWKARGWNGRFEAPRAQAAPALQAGQSRAAATPLGAVQAYEEVVIEAPTQDVPTGRSYAGPERRGGGERRHAA